MLNHFHNLRISAFFLLHVHGVIKPHVLRIHGWKSRVRQLLKAFFMCIVGIVGQVTIPFVLSFRLLMHLDSLVSDYVPGVIGMSMIGRVEALQLILKKKQHLASDLVKNLFLSPHRSINF